MVKQGNVAEIRSNRKGRSWSKRSNGVLADFHVDWSNILVKHWSKADQRLVKHWSKMFEHGSKRSNSGQASLSHRSVDCSKRLDDLTSGQTRLDDLTSGQTEGGRFGQRSNRQVVKYDLTSGQTDKGQI
jgi:hypothetical protein